MRSPLLLLLAAVACEAAPRIFDRNCDVSSRRSDRGGVACSVADAGVASGVGMTAACAGTTVTGSRGEALTFSRSGVAWCTKGNITTGIVAGDLVSIADGVPRIMPGGDGTGTIGIDIRAARTNSTLRSAEIDNAAWSSSASGAAAPTVTANAAVGPDGVTAAERLQFPLSTIGQFTTRRQVGAGRETEPIDMCNNNATIYYCVKTTLNASTWTRVNRENGDGTGGSHLLNFGNVGVDTATSATLGVVARNALDVYVWQADCQVGTTITVPITTVGTTVVRPQETASFPVALTGQNRCWGTTVVVPSALPADESTMLWGGTSANAIGLITVGGKARCKLRVADDDYLATSTASITLSASNRIVCKYDGALLTVCLNGVCETAAQTITAPSTTTLNIGTRDDASLPFSGTYSKVVAAENTTWCGS